MICNICQNNVARTGHTPRMFALSSNDSVDYHTMRPSAPAMVMMCPHRLTEQQLLQVLAPVALYVLDSLAALGVQDLLSARAVLMHRATHEAVLDVEKATMNLLAGTYE